MIQKTEKQKLLDLLSSRVRLQKRIQQEDGLPKEDGEKAQKQRHLILKFHALLKQEQKNDIVTPINEWGLLALGDRAQDIIALKPLRQ